MIAPPAATSTRSAREAAVAAIDAAATELVALSKYVHDHPEIAMEERLAERGFAVERGVAGLPTAFAAEAGAPVPASRIWRNTTPCPGSVTAAATT